MGVYSRDTFQKEGGLKWEKKAKGTNESSFSCPDQEVPGPFQWQTKQLELVSAPMRPGIEPFEHLNITF